VDIDRMVTIACAQRDWRLSTGLRVLQERQNDELVSAFLERALDAELAEHNRINRQQAWETAGKAALPRPSNRPLNKLTTEGRRGLLWLDDGSVYEQEDVGGTVVWMVLAGRRESGSRRNVYDQHAELLGDGNDPWLPVDPDDYQDLFDLRDKGRLVAARESIRQAATEAARHPNRRVTVEIDRLDEVSVAEAHQEERVNGFVVDCVHARYFVISKFYADNGKPVPESYADALADAAFDDDMEWGTVSFYDLPLEDWDHLDPNGVYTYAADLG
jgi:hypothetical protein